MKEGTYLSGKKHGLWRTFYKSGQLERTGQHVNGFSEGYFESFHENGQLRSREKYERSKRVGRYVFYHPDGRLELSGFDKIINRCKGKDNGSYVFTDPNLFNDSKKIIKGHCKNGKKEGRWTTTYGHDGRTGVKNYKDGERHGADILRYEDGGIQYSGFYRNGDLHGRVFTRTRKGHLSSEGRYENGKRIGRYVLYSIHYTDSEVVEREEKYRNGRLDGLRRVRCTSYCNGKMYTNSLYLDGILVE